MKRIRKVIIALLIFIIVGLLMGYLEYNGYIWHTSVFTSKFTVRGIDVSHWQGDIDWEEVKGGNYKFAFIKATEGTTFVDNRYQENWDNSRKAGVLRGAYHYLTIGSSGEEQARNFIRVVPVEDNALPPVIDIEVGGIPKEVFQKELWDFIKLIEENYNQKPILYVVYPLYNEYIKGDFKEYKIWIRDIIKYPNLSDNRDWTFWQYCNRGRIKGIDTYVDLNVFIENEDELMELLLKE